VCNYCGEKLCGWGWDGQIRSVVFKGPLRMSRSPDHDVVSEKSRVANRRTRRIYDNDANRTRRSNHHSPSITLGSASGSSNPKFSVTESVPSTRCCTLSGGLNPPRSSMSLAASSLTYSERASCINLVTTSSAGTAASPICCTSRLEIACWIRGLASRL